MIKNQCSRSIMLIFAVILLLGTTSACSGRNKDQDNRSSDQAQTIRAQSTNAKWQNVANSIIKEAKSYMGTPYVYGTQRFEDKAFDCSSFVQYVYADHGIKLGWNAREQARQGQWIPYEQMRKGDLMFFWDDDYPNETGLDKVKHVGIYMGNKEILHTYEVGTGVTISEILHDVREGDYWYQHFLFAKRVIAG